MRDHFYDAAVASIAVSTFALVMAVFAVPMLFHKSDYVLHEMSVLSDGVKAKSDMIWNELMEIRQGSDASGIQYFSRKPRSNWMGGTFCKGCFLLSCPQGPPGPPGASGPDGQPGDAGRQGRAGDDGFDIQPESEPELPCVICPAGPPGPRGAQGERGMTGNPGQSGMQGPNGMEGMDGGPGLPGLPGPKGNRGPLGPYGPAGDTVVAGVGIKGPPGPPGPQGMKGPPGPGGKGSNQPGQPGQPGEAGGIGKTGKMGGYGMEGPAGPPGDPGMPASYCPSDCGVQPILTEMFPTPFTPISGYGNVQRPAAPRPRAETEITEGSAPAHLPKKSHHKHVAQQFVDPDLGINAGLDASAPAHLPHRTHQTLPPQFADPDLGINVDALTTQSTQTAHGQGFDAEGLALAHQNKHKSHNRRPHHRQEVVQESIGNQEQINSVINDAVRSVNAPEYGDPNAGAQAYHKAAHHSPKGIDTAAEAYANRMHDFQDFEKKWRRKLLQRRLRMMKRQ